MVLCTNTLHFTWILKQVVILHIPKIINIYMRVYFTCNIEVSKMLYTYDKEQNYIKK